MKPVKLFEEFLNGLFIESNSHQLSLQKHAMEMQKKYSIHEIGLIRAWGTTLYLAYYNLPKSGTVVPYKEYVEILSEYAVLSELSDEYEDITDWISDSPPTINRVPVWNQSRLENDFNKIANKTPTDREITLYRTSKKEEPGLNSYSLISGVYGDVVNQREYLLPTGTPIIWGHGVADDNEVIWSPTLDELKEAFIKKNLF